MFNGWQTWKLHTIWDYVFFGLIVACGILFFMAWTAVLKKNRTREKALKRSAERVRKALGAGTEVFTDCELSLNGEREAAELLAVGGDRVFVGRVYPFGLTVTGGANVPQWTFADRNEIRKEQNPMPQLRRAKALLAKIFADEKLKSIPVEFLVVLADNYGMARFKLDGVEHAVQYQRLGQYLKGLPKKFAGTIDRQKTAEAIRAHLSDPGNRSGA